jgi:hypothetical protein
MKNLYHKLPKKEQKQIDKILKLATPSSIPKCILKLIDWQLYIQKFLLPEINDKLQLKYLKFVINKIKKETVFRKHIPAV